MFPIFHLATESTYTLTEQQWFLPSAFPVSGTLSQLFRKLVHEDRGAMRTAGQGSHAPANLTGQPREETEYFTLTCLESLQDPG